jgi:hypothetical protein
MLDDRFWTKVDKTAPNGCWVWTANRNNKGYGMFRPGGIAPKELAHRLSYQDAKGEIPKGAFILHSCDNPACVNPDHLRVGSAKQNVADMDKRKRRVSTPLRGEDNPTSLLAQSEVIDLRKSYIAGDSIPGICARFGVSRHSLTDYTSGRSWRHILGQDGCPTLAELKAENRRRQRSNAALTPKDVLMIRNSLRHGATGVALARRLRGLCRHHIRHQARKNLARRLLTSLRILSYAIGRLLA